MKFRIGLYAALLVSAICGSLNAQFTIYQSEVHKGYQTLNPHAAIPIENGGVLIFANYQKPLSTSKIDYAYKYDGRMNLIEQKELDLNGGKFQGAIKTASKIIVFWTEETGSESKIYAQLFDSDKMELAGNKKLLDQTSTGGITGLNFKDKRQAFYQLAHTGSSNHFWLINTAAVKAATGSVGYRLISFDENLNRTSSGKVEAKVQGDFAYYINAKMSDDGGLYLLYKIYLDGKKDMKNKKPNYVYLCAGYNLDGTERFKTEIGTDEHFVTEADIEISDNGELWIAGFIPKGVRFPPKVCLYAY
ncbi:MAG: hypothetical protein Kow0075_15250 [Salibacteraceae bacterium]